MQPLVEITTIPSRVGGAANNALSRHCLGTLTTVTSGKLYDGEKCREKVREIIARSGASSLGDHLYEFPNGAFSLVVALVESHVSIHTWPERLTVQLDVFLCNYMRDNTSACQHIYDEIVYYFDRR